MNSAHNIPSEVPTTIQDAEVHTLGQYSRNQLTSRGTEVFCESLKGDAFVKTSIYVFIFKERTEVLPQTDVL